jgi:hypothetical protein
LTIHNPGDKLTPNMNEPRALSRRARRSRLPSPREGLALAFS